jgi:hypothetical protein
MPPAKIYRFPKAARRRPAPPPQVRRAYRGSPGDGVCGYHGGGQLLLTMVAAGLYLSGAAGVARHDALYTALLVAVWGLYFLHKPLRRRPVIGPLLEIAGQVLLLAGVFSSFGFLYWLILAHD